MFSTLFTIYVLVAIAVGVYRFQTVGPDDSATLEKMVLWPKYALPYALAVLAVLAAIALLLVAFGVLGALGVFGLFLMSIYGVAYGIHLVIEKLKTIG